MLFVVERDVFSCPRILCESFCVRGVAIADKLISSSIGWRNSGIKRSEIKHA